MLQLSGNVAGANADLCQILGADNCSRITVDEKTGVVIFDTKDLGLGAADQLQCRNASALLKLKLPGTEWPTK
jgi:hypothetical protein